MIKFVIGIALCVLVDASVAAQEGCVQFWDGTRYVRRCGPRTECVHTFNGERWVLQCR